MLLFSTGGWRRAFCSTTFYFCHKIISTTSGLTYPLLNAVTLISIIGVRGRALAWIFIVLPIARRSKGFAFIFASFGFTLFLLDTIFYISAGSFYTFNRIFKILIQKKAFAKGIRPLYLLHSYLARENLFPAFYFCLLTTF